MLYNLLLTTNGAYTGKLYLAGTNYSFIGSFDIYRPLDDERRANELSRRPADA